MDLQPPEPDDIPDPVVPAAALPPDPPGADSAADLFRLITSGLKAMDVTFVAMEARLAARLNSLAPMQADALEHVCQALEGLASHGLCTEAANSVNFRVKSPNGFTLQLTLRRPTGAELFDALTKAQGWLLAQGYTPVD